MREVISIDGERLTMEQVAAVARGAPGEPRVELTTSARSRVKRSADAVSTLLEKGQIAYGITTRFGAFKDRVIPLDQVERLQRNIVLSHSVGVGPPFDQAMTRA